MWVFKRKNDKVWHFVATTRWEKEKNTPQLVTYMVQKLCEDRATPVPKSVKFEMVDYKREDHSKNLCAICKEKAQK